MHAADGHGFEQEEVEQQRAAGMGGASLGSTTGAAALEEEVGEEVGEVIAATAAASCGGEKIENKKPRRNTSRTGALFI